MGRGVIFRDEEPVRPSMNASLWSMWNSAERLGIVRPSAAEWSLLILLGASVLALRALRESYLKIWVLGWIALVACRLAEHCLAAKMPRSV